MEPNVLNFFLVVLGGFGVVWSFRLFSGRKEKSIGDFEYLAFSTIWGIPNFLAFWWLKGGRPEDLKMAMEIPMAATPGLFLLGIFFGAVGTGCLIVLNYLWRKLKVR
jgi:hypothetical protein